MSDDITPEEIAQAAADFRAAKIDGNTFFLEDVDGRREYLVFDDATDTARLVVSEDLTLQQEACKTLFNEPVNHKSEFRRIASWPPSVLQLWGRLKYGITDEAWFFKREYEHLLMRAAHDRDLAQFRTCPGTYLRRGD